MNDFPGSERLDRDLGHVADRIARAGYDPSETLRRLHRAERWPLIALVATLVGIAAALAEGERSVAFVFACLVLPNRIYDWRARAAERDALLAGDDFLERERANLERRVRGEHIRAGAGLAFALLLALVAAFGPHGALRLWFAAIVAVVALMRLVAIEPALVRELRDLDGQAPSRRSAVVTVVLIALLPFLVIGRVIYRSVRRLIGRPVKDDE